MIPFRVLTEAGPEEVSLPTLLELFGEDAVRQLVGIQRYQADAFHVFLAYLGGAVLARRGDTSPVQAADYWRTGLMELAGLSGACLGIGRRQSSSRCVHATASAQGRKANYCGIYS